VRLRLYANKPCLKHDLFAFWIGSEIYCKKCLAEMDEETRKALCRFWAELIISTLGKDIFNGNQKDTPS
jgi:hypothetical protein